MTDTDIQSNPTCIAFCDSRKLAAGGLGDVALAVKAALEADAAQQILVFDSLTSRPIDFDLRGDAADILARLAPKPVAGEEAMPARPGRPKLGVVAREVTLLPRHWDWLASQPGGASVTLRKLVEAARRQQAGDTDRRQAQESTYRFMSAMTGNEAGFEEATRALFAGDRDRFTSLIAGWPQDLRDHIASLAAAVFVTQ
ncbi:MAG TPA: DUF2239 family protein [Terriglobales bacterium]|nr:DUF2239 family protein [Terriglobales bacterium]